MIKSRNALIKEKKKRLLTKSSFICSISKEVIENFWLICHKHRVNK